jgi:GT2 family glycosyltransferase
MTVLVAIVSYNSGKTLPRCLEALKAQTFKDFSLLLIDNASDERPGTMLANLPFPTTYLEMETNLGFAGAMSVALDKAEGPFLAALNPDAFPDPTWLAELMAAVDRHPKVAAFGSLQLSTGKRTRIDGFGDHYTVWGEAWRGERLPPPDPGDGVFYSFGVCAAAALYRTRVVRAVGGFDDRFFCFYEDVDLSFRLRLAGHQCAVVQGAVVKHVGGASFEDKTELAQFLITRNQWRVLIKDMPLPFLCLAAPILVAIHSLAVVVSGKTARFKGLMAGIRETGSFWESRRRIQSDRRISNRQLSRWLTWAPGKFSRKDSPVVAPAAMGRGPR